MNRREFIQAVGLGAAAAGLVGRTANAEEGRTKTMSHTDEGRADLYPRFGPTMEWDSAAGHAIVEAAGGSVTMRDGGALRYGKAGFLNPHFLVRGLPD